MIRSKAGPGSSAAGGFLSATYEDYALGLARKDSLPPSRGRSGKAAFRRLTRLGARGWPSRSTLFTRELPAGCGPCLRGRGSTLTLTTLCNRDCPFCFNPAPRRDGMSVHGRPAGTLDEAAAILRRAGAASVGVSGGEPLLFPRRVLALARGLHRRVRGLRLELYTNGDLLTPRLLGRLKAAGVSSLRLNLAANGYDPKPAALALPVFPDLAVEIPVVPADRDRIARLMAALDRLGVRHLILHELFWSAQNLDRLRAAGLKARPGAGKLLAWRAVAGSEEAALGLLEEALRSGRRLGVYYCSTGTQEWIARRSRRR